MPSSLIFIFIWIPLFHVLLGLFFSFLSCSSSSSCPLTVPCGSNLDPFFLSPHHISLANLICPYGCSVSVVICWWLWPPAQASLLKWSQGHIGLVHWKFDRHVQPRTFKIYLLFSNLLLQCFPSSLKNTKTLHQLLRLEAHLTPLSPDTQSTTKSLQLP